MVNKMVDNAAGMGIGGATLGDAIQAPDFRNPGEIPT
jgi:hypothetical protein